MTQLFTQHFEPQVKSLRMTICSLTCLIALHWLQYDGLNWAQTTTQCHIILKTQPKQNWRRNQINDINFLFKVFFFFFWRSKKLSLRLWRRVRNSLTNTRHGHSPFHIHKRKTFTRDSIALSCQQQSTLLEEKKKKKIPHCVRCMGLRRKKKKTKHTTNINALTSFAFMERPWWYCRRNWLEKQMMDKPNQYVCAL